MYDGFDQRRHAGHGVAHLMLLWDSVKSSSLSAINFARSARMARGFGIAGLVIAIIAVFVPVVGIIISLIAIALVVIAALAGDRIFATATALIAFVNTMFLSPTTWIILWGRDEEISTFWTMLIIAIVALPFIAMALNAAGMVVIGKSNYSPGAASAKDWWRRDDRRGEKPKDRDEFRPVDGEQSASAPLAQSRQASQPGYSGRELDEFDSKLREERLNEDEPELPLTPSKTATPPDSVEIVEPKSDGTSAESNAMGFSGFTANSTASPDNIFRFAVLGVAGIVALAAIGVAGLLGWKYLDARLRSYEMAVNLQTKEWKDQKSRSPVPLSRQEEYALKAKDEFKECAKCPVMVVVPAGSFTMGSPEDKPMRDRYKQVQIETPLKADDNVDWDRYDQSRYPNNNNPDWWDHVPDEGPQHEVTFAEPFAAGKFTVTFDEWDACAADGGCCESYRPNNQGWGWDYLMCARDRDGYKPSDNGWGRGRRPVINVSWNNAKAYVAWLSKKTGKTYRLLSEAEWEYVARGGTTTPFWWGSSISTKQANYRGDGGFSEYNGGTDGDEDRGMTVPVDSFAPNPFGLYNVHGNVSQWVEDCYHSDYSGAPTDGSAWTTGACGKVVNRGGSYGSLPEYLRAAARGRNPPNFGDQSGFRVARTLIP